jgi:hypothetical protein
MCVPTAGSNANTKNKASLSDSFPNLIAAAMKRVAPEPRERPTAQIPAPPPPAAESTGDDGQRPCDREEDQPFEAPFRDPGHVSERDHSGHECDGDTPHHSPPHLHGGSPSQMLDARTGSDLVLLR